MCLVLCHFLFFLFFLFALTLFSPLLLSCSASITMQEATSPADSFVNVNYCSLSGVVLAQGEQHLQG